MELGDETWQHRWDRAASGFRDLLIEAEADPGTVSESVGIFSLAGVTDTAFLEAALKNLAAWHEPEWRLASSEQPGGLLFALPVPESAPKSGGSDFLFVDTHSAMVDWWLLTAWRVGGLVDALDGQADPIVAATIARSLLESAAALWGDAKRVHELWSTAKDEVVASGHAVSAWATLWRELEVITDGSKFTDGAAQAKATWGSFQRRNVLNEIQSLQKATDVDVVATYEWLCNIVHPSVGTMILHSDLWFHHVSGTHRVRTTRRKNLADALRTSSDRSAVLAIAEGGTFAVEVVTIALDSVLRVIDDVSITCDVASYSKFESWRKTRASGQRNLPCPCRSGRKAKACSHGWVKPAPVLPQLRGIPTA